MKKLMIIAAVAALGACADREEEAVEPVAVETTAADMGTMAGTYDVEMADGRRGTTVINEDGTYVDTDDKGVETRGRFARRDGKDCFDPDGDAPEECWTVEAPAADGSFVATGPDGTKVTVRPAGATATGAATTTTTTTASPTPAAT